MPTEMWKRHETQTEEGMNLLKDIIRTQWPCKFKCVCPSTVKSPVWNVGGD